jgi:hypothetical protein
MSETQKRKLLGAWRLKSYDVLIDGQRRPSILGESPVGLLIYHADGFMSATMMAADRPLLNAASLMAADDAAALAAGRSCIAYSGRFDVAGDHVHHHVMQSLLPDWVGQTLVRTIGWQHDNLTLSPPDDHTASGKTVQRVLTWRRAADPQQ